MAEAASKFEGTVERFKDAACRLAGVAYQRSSAHKYDLLKRGEGELRARFGLPPDRAIRGLAQVVGADKRHRTRRPKFRVRATGPEGRSKAEPARPLGLSDSYLAAQTGRAPDQLRSIPDAEPPRPDGPAGPHPDLEPHVRTARDAGLATPMADPAPRADPARRRPEKFLDPEATRATSAILGDRQATARRQAQLVTERDPNPVRGDLHIRIIPPEREEAAAGSRSHRRSTATSASRPTDRPSPPRPSAWPA